MNFKILLISLLVATTLWAKEAPAKLPEFALPGIDGVIEKTTNWKGKIVVLDFWATWCVACRDAFPVLNDLQQKYEGEILIFGISSDKSSSEKVAKFAKKHDIQYPILLDSEDKLSAVFGFSSIPSLYVYDRSGKLLLSLSGLDDANRKKLESTIKSIK